MIKMGMYQKPWLVRHFLESTRQQFSETGVSRLRNLDKEGLQFKLYKDFGIPLEESGRMYKKDLVDLYRNLYLRELERLRMR